MTIEARIRGDIEARIRSGEWSPGMRIPFEHQLVVEYGCARATVNKALTRLAREGLIERRRRAGSFVAHPRIHSAIIGVPDIGALITARGEAYRWQLASRNSSFAPQEVETRSRGRWMALEGVHHSGSLPFGVEARWINIGAVPKADHADFAVEAPGTWLLGHVAWTDARHRISAAAASAMVARVLRIREGDACLQIERWTWRSGVPVTFVRQVFPGDRYDLVEDFTPR